jgi:hypothetical protein
MIQVKLLKKTSLGKRYSVIQVSRNIAHGLIERGEAKIYKPKKLYRNRMMKNDK